MENNRNILTNKEYAVLKLIASGYENKEIATMLKITNHTVKAHISSMLKKLNAKNRTHLAVISITQKIILSQDLELTD